MTSRTRELLQTSKEKSVIQTLTSNTNIQNKSSPYYFYSGSDRGNSVNYDDSVSRNYYVPIPMAITDSSSDEDVDMPNNLPDTDIFSNYAQHSSVTSLNDVELSNNQTLNTNNNEEHVDEVDGLLEFRTNEIEPTEPKRSKKLNKSNWKRTVSKNLRLKGLNYTNISGKEISEKLPKLVDCSKCRFKCNNTFSDEERFLIGKEYWNLGNDQQQKLLISSLILNKPVNRRKMFTKDKRKTSREFFRSNSSGEKNRVCLKFFCGTFSISQRVVEICMKKVDRTGVYVGYDGRSEISFKRYNLTSDDIKHHIKTHIDSFPRVESQYCRKDNKKQYLAPGLNLSLMYRLYRDEYCKKNNTIPVSDFVYRSVFHDYNPSLSFFIPKKDQYSKCKSAFDNHRHDNTNYSDGEVMVMKRCPIATRESTKLQDRYRGPLVVTEKLPGDVYRVVQLNKDKRSRFATTAHVIQQKSWKLHGEEDNEIEVNQEDDETVANQDEKGEVEPREGTVEILGRPIRKRRSPVWAQYYV